MTRQEIVQLVLSSGDLVPEARTVLGEELVARGFEPGYHAILAVEVDSITDEELDQLVARVQREPCPMCKRTTTSLNGFRRTFVRRRKRFWTVVIGCVSCIASEPSGGLLIGAALPLRLETGQRWDPTPELVRFVRLYAAVLVAFAGEPAIFGVVVRRDWPTLFRIVGNARAGQAALERVRARSLPRPAGAPTNEERLPKPVAASDAESNHLPRTATQSEPSDSSDG